MAGDAERISLELARQILEAKTVRRLIEQMKDEIERLPMDLTDPDGRRLPRDQVVDALIERQGIRKGVEAVLGLWRTAELRIIEEEEAAAAEREARLAGMVPSILGDVLVKPMPSDGDT